ncbi:MAG: acyl-CoA carboxylase subunit beta [Acidimicrobiales bacterium]
MGTVAAPRLPIASDRSGSGAAGIGQLAGFDDRPVAWFHGAVTAADAPVMTRAIRAGIDNGIPVVGVVDRAGLEPDAGLAALSGLGMVARELAAASGVVPTALVLDGPCLGAPAVAAGLVDLVVMTDQATMFVNGPAATARMTGIQGLDPQQLGGPWAHSSRSGVADAVATDVTESLEVVGDVLSFLPANSLEVPPTMTSADPPDRGCGNLAVVVPSNDRSSYDVRDVIAEVADDHWFVELRASYGASLVVGFARIAGLPVGVVANQPSQLAGALDIESSLKGARFVRWCDSFNLPLLTLVDTPGFRPGRDQEWRGIVRHGAKLAFAYAEATVPRVSVVLRKAYGGAYIVMDCKSMGNDCALAWATAEIAVMGAKGAVEIVHRKALQRIEDAGEREARRVQLEADYSTEHLSPRVAAERGYIDGVIDPAATRLAVAEALMALSAKREKPVRRRHENIPL